MINSIRTGKGIRPKEQVITNKKNKGGGDLSTENLFRDGGLAREVHKTNWSGIKEWSESQSRRPDRKLSKRAPTLEDYDSNRNRNRR